MEVVLFSLSDTVRLPSSGVLQLFSSELSTISNQLIVHHLENFSELKRKKKRKRPDYFIKIEVPLFSVNEFKSHFRMNRTTVEELIKIVGPVIKNTNGRPQHDIEKQVLFSIWVLANPECFRSVALRFGLERGNSHRVFMRFIFSVYSLRSRFIVWPKGEQQNKVLRGFNNLRRVAIPGTIGAVDGCQIKIKQPSNDKSSYSNRNRCSSVNLQALCDHNKLFTDVYAGFPGAAHNCHVWKSSPIFLHLKDNLDSQLQVLGDSAYPLSTFCLVRYKDYGDLTPQQKYFNYVLSSIRAIIEQAFGLLKCRFRRLKYLDMCLMKDIGKVITVCCIVHNICIMNNDLLQYTRERRSTDDDENEENNINATAKREEISRILWLNKG